MRQKLLFVFSALVCVTLNSCITTTDLFTGGAAVYDVDVTNTEVVSLKRVGAGGSYQTAGGLLLDDNRDHIYSVALDNQNGSRMGGASQGGNLIPVLSNLATTIGIFQLIMGSGANDQIAPLAFIGGLGLSLIINEAAFSGFNQARILGKTRSALLMESEADSYAFPRETVQSSGGVLTKKWNCNVELVEVTLTTIEDMPRESKVQVEPVQPDQRRNAPKVAEVDQTDDGIQVGNKVSFKVGDGEATGIVKSLIETPNGVIANVEYSYRGEAKTSTFPSSMLTLVK
ncbi:MAG: hypothetical protein CMC99_06550 [Flavobacteriales bacterium]|nr:hypothetical protein [Flavobacteriales bacterium]